jgi:hypothetical protein
LDFHGLKLSIPFFGQDIAGSMNIMMLLITTPALVHSARRLLSSGANRTCLQRIGFIDFFKRDSFRLVFVLQVFQKLTKLPLSQLLIHRFASLLPGMALDAFHIPNDNVSDSLFGAPMDELPAHFMKGIPQFSFGF